MLLKGGAELEAQKARCSIILLLLVSVAKLGIIVVIILETLYLWSLYPSK